MSFQTVHYTITDQRISKELSGYRIALFADAHDCQARRWESAVLAEMRRFRPDVVLIPGDMVRKKKYDHDAASGWASAERFLKQLASEFRVIYATGNHERRLAKLDPEAFEAYLDRVEKSGAKVLRNASLPLQNGTLLLTGLDLPGDTYLPGRRLKGTDLERMLPQGEIAETDTAAYRILLAHTPRFAQTYADWGADLTLSGHVHGGMFRLPKLGGVLSPHKEIFPRYTRGLYRLAGGRQLLVTAGLGHQWYRINNPEELVLIELAGKEA